MTSKTIFFKNSLYNIITNFVFSIIFFIPYLLNKYYLNIHELAALSLAQNYLEFFIYLFYFLRISTVVFLGKAFGAKNTEDITVGYVKGLIFAFFLGILGSFILRSIPVRAGNSPLVLLQAKEYINIASLGFPFVLMNFINFGAYLALQKKILLLIHTFIYVVIYILITFIHIHYFQNGILGLAGNFSIFPVFNFFFGYILLRKNFNFSLLSVKKIFYNIQEYISFNQTLLLRSFLIEVSYLSYIYTISFFHEKAFILYSFSLRLLFFFTTFLESFLYTFESLGTQALGEKNKEKFIQLIKNNLFVSTLATLLCLGIIVLSFSSLIHIFNIPIESLHFFRYAVLCISIALVFSNFTYIYEGILISFEKSKALLIGTFFGTIFLLSCFYLSYRFQFFEGVWIGMIGFYIIKTGIYKYYSVGALTSNLD